jgi:acyl-homoserine lactone acylase PvdQ
MARIKSALEVALERTQDVQGDKSKLEEFDERQRGKKIYAQLTTDPDFDVRKALEEVPQKNKDWVKAGFFEAILSNLNLPNDANDTGKLKTLRKGVESIVKDRRAATIFDQLEKFYGQYLENKTQLIEAVRKQLEGRLRQKEEELSRQAGRKVRIDPAADPEFSQFLKQNLGNLQAQYSEVLEQVRTELTDMWKKSK